MSKITRFFTQTLPEGQKVSIQGDEARHMKVLRLKKGDQICMFDGKGNELIGRIDAISPQKAEITVLSREKVSPEGVMVDLATAMPKGKRMDWLVQKTTELGIVRIMPLITHRGVVKPKGTQKSERWQKIAIEAAKQSERATIPDITPAVEFQELLGLIDGYDLKIIALPTAKQNLKEVLRSKKPQKILCLVGPEGGFTDEEIENAIAAGFTPANIGKQILRIETAGMAILAMIKYEYEK